VRRLFSLLVFVGLGTVSLACEQDPEPTCAESCADGNPCTIDRCVDGACVSEPAPVGFSCSDDDACNGVEACDAAGTCAPGVSVITNDQDPCTADTCDPVTGEVGHTLKSQCVTWATLPTEGAPTARQHHSMVWTGERAIVWGGVVNDDPPVTGTGAAYDPVARVWTPISTTGAPSPRHSHTAVWTGSRMLVWGGYGTSAYESTGALYDPVSDTWTPMSTVGAPAGRTRHAAAWSGTRLLVSGGLGPAVLGDAATYDPGTDTWAPITTGLSPRFAHSGTALADGRVMNWAGQNTFDWLNDGSMVDPSGAMAVEPTSPIGVPGTRESVATVLAGNVVYLWGGWTGGPYVNEGFVFDPAGGPGGTWAALPVEGAPTARIEHVALWTGTDLFVWGGCGGEACGTALGDGALFRPDAGDPAIGTWTEIAAGELSARHDATAVWAGDRAIVWGGRGQSGALLGSGAESVIAN
jgi:hypothetical protein